MKPQHKHDCSNCKYLGSIGVGDAYYCVSPNDKIGIDYVLRYGPDGPDYSSKTDFQNRKQKELREQILGGDEKYYLRITLINLLATAITNVMEGCYEAEENQAADRGDI